MKDNSRFPALQRLQTDAMSYSFPSLEEKGHASGRKGIPAMVVLYLASCIWIQAQNPAPAPSQEQAKEPPKETEKIDRSAGPVSSSWTGQSTFLSIGKRDPFKSPLDEKKASQQPSLDTVDVPPARNKRPLGPPGTLISEIKLMGVAQGMGSKLAMINCGGTITYFLREGERLYDGYIKEINANEVTFVREVKSQNKIIRQQEVTVSVHPAL